MKTKRLVSGWNEDETARFPAELETKREVSGGIEDETRGLGRD
jgi:hypothetical protein